MCVCAADVRLVSTVMRVVSQIMGHTVYSVQLESSGIYRITTAKLDIDLDREMLLPPALYCRW